MRRIGTIHINIDKQEIMRSLNTNMECGVTIMEEIMNNMVIEVITIQNGMESIRIETLKFFMGATDHMGEKTNYWDDDANKGRKND